MNSLVAQVNMHKSTIIIDILKSPGIFVQLLKGWKLVGSIFIPFDVLKWARLFHFIISKLYHFVNRSFSACNVMTNEDYVGHAA